MAGLYELTLNFERGYYVATTAGGKHFDIINNSSLANSFYTTQIFTKDQIPVGSVIIIEEGWQYRPEGWIGDAQLTIARPGNVSTTMIVVDEAWWGSFTHRAFNVQKNPSSSLTNYTPEDMAEILKIYVPYDPSATEPEPEPDPNDPLYGLYELELDFQKGYYAANTAGGKHFDVVNNTALSNNYYTTQIFTQEEIPVGSVIIIEEGWQYRPEGWIGDAQLTIARPGNVSTTMIVVDEAWWGNFTYRAFNVQKNPSSSLESYTPEDMTSILKIYVPYNSNAEEPEP